MEPSQAALLASIVTSSDDAIISVDRDGRITSWNPGAERVLGYPAAGMLGKPLSLLTPRSPEGIDPEIVDSVVAGGPTDHREAGLVCRDGSVVELSLTTAPIVTESGEIVGASVTARRLPDSVTDHLRSEEMFRGLLEAAPDAVVIVDGEGLISLVNRQAETMFAVTRSQLIGEPVEVLVPQRLRERHRRHLRDFLHQPQVRPMGFGLELSGLRGDGSEFPVEISLSPLDMGDSILVSAAIRDITARKMTEARLAYQATHDLLTGLPNRSLLTDRLNRSLARFRRRETSLAVMFIDVDRLKVVNDRFGHTVGDELLRAVASRLADTVRSEDSLIRFGGDEFVVVAESPAADNGPELLGRRLTEAFTGPVQADGLELNVSLSIGIALATPGDDPEALLRDADMAMYRAKEQGRNCCVVFDATVRAGVSERVEAERALRYDIERGRIDVHYQPVIDLAGDRITAIEALARWEHPRRGMLLPVSFIPLAEETGLILPLGALILERACREVGGWIAPERAGGPLTLAVNLSARRLVQPDLVASVAATLRDSGLDPRQLCLELTESVLLGNADAAVPTLRALKDMGVLIAVDDFGTGYSSLTHLRSFPLDILKIDKSFVDGLGRSGGAQPDRAIVAGVIDLARALGLTSVAEGVETEAQVEALRELGCDQAQGFYWSQALPGPAALDWIGSWRPARPDPEAGTSAGRPPAPEAGTTLVPRS